MRRRPLIVIEDIQKRERSSVQEGQGQEIHFLFFAGRLLLFRARERLQVFLAKWPEFQTGAYYALDLNLMLTAVGWCLDAIDLRLGQDGHQTALAQVHLVQERSDISSDVATARVVAHPGVLGSRDSVADIAADRMDGS